MSEYQTGRGSKYEDRKSFFPLESNPELFTQLIHDLGVSPSLAFHDVLSIDDPDLLAIIPRPVHALVLVFITSPAYEQQKAEEEAKRTDYTGSGDDEPVVWFKQTIYNACGLYGILHGVSNGPARAFIKGDSILGNILKAAIPLGPAERALVLENSPELEKVHTAVALQGQTAPPEHAYDEVGHHYTCFVQSSKNGHIYELDGDKKGPIDLGPVLGEGDDALSPAALNAVRRYLQRDGHLQYSLLALSEV